jgi:hypothetical protein
MKINLNPFARRNSMEKLTAELAILTARRDALLAKQSAAKIALDRALDARQLHLTDGDINDEQIALKKQAAVDTAASALAGFEIASSAMASRVADAQARLDKETQTVAASKASEKLAGQIDTLDNLHVSGSKPRARSWSRSTMSGRHGPKCCKSPDFFAALPAKLKWRSTSDCRRFAISLVTSAMAWRQFRRKSQKPLQSRQHHRHLSLNWCFQSSR